MNYFFSLNKLSKQTDLKNNTTSVLLCFYVAPYLPLRTAYLFSNGKKKKILLRLYYNDINVVKILEILLKKTTQCPSVLYLSKCT